MSRIVRLPVSALAEGPRQLDAAQSKYLVAVHRLGAGDRFLVFDPETASEADATLERVDPRAAWCRLGAPRPCARGPELDVTLVQAIGKADKADRVVRDATALGVRRVVVVESERSVVRLGARGPRRLQRWRTVALEAARQSERGDVPLIEGPEPLGAALKRLAGESLRGVCLQPDAPLSLAEALAAWRPDEPLCLVIGPEGGLTPDEVAAAARLGFSVARLGPLVLRTETAAPAALGAVLALRSGVVPSG